MRWNASAFSTRNRDDILFISNALAAGYFTNFGRTQRQGIELDAGGSFGSIDWSVAYSHLRATYESPACIVSGSNSTAETVRKLHRRRRDRGARGRHAFPACRATASS